MRPSEKKIDKKEACPQCLRPVSQCFCAKVLPLKNSVKILILQHPQEQYKLLNSAMLTHKLLKNSVLRVGLSWRNFSHALGEQADARQWGVLFLKSGASGDAVVQAADPKKRPLSILPVLQGIVVIDGSWKQAKAMWWRNPWLLKLNRIALNPRHPSLRVQVKPEGLSTIESVALALRYFKENEAISPALTQHYEEYIIRPNAHSPMVS